MDNMNINREEWLTQSAELINTLIITPAIEKHNIVVENDTIIAVSIGHPKSKNAIGENWARRASEDKKTNQIFITPHCSDSLRILDVLVHEMCYSFDDNKNGHKGRFATLARACGLDGLLTATVASPELIETLKSIVDVLGEIPHTKLDASLSGRKKQKGRMLKIICSDCGFKFNTSKLQIERIKPDSECNCCGASGTFIDSIIEALA